MSENLNRGSRDFSKYDTMETAELEEILRLDAALPEGAESDTELLLYVMGVLADRRRNNGVAGKTAFEAWESFEKNYMPSEEENEVSPAKKSSIVLAPWMRRAIAAAAVLVLLVTLPLSANALDLEDLWDIIARWAKETFSFVSGEDTEITEPVPPGEEGFVSLQDALIKSNRDPSIVPTWIPDRYVFENVTKEIFPSREVYVALYNSNCDVLRILIHSYLSDDQHIVEIDGDSTEVYSSDGVDYYIVTNQDQLQVIWIHESFECIISGTLTIDEIHKMIDSIGKGLDYA